MKAHWLKVDTPTVEAMLIGLEKSKNQVEIYNVGSEDQNSVKTIAEIVVKEMGLKTLNPRSQAASKAEEDG